MHDNHDNTAAGYYRGALRSDRRRLADVVREALDTPVGRVALVERRHELAALYASNLSLDADAYPSSVERARRALHELTAFDAAMHSETGIITSTGRVRHRGTGELGYVLDGFERDVVGMPYVRVRFDGENPPGSLVPLVDAERVTD